MSQILDREVDEWRLLDDILPLFSPDLRSIWTMKKDTTPDEDVEAKLISFKSHVVNFTTDMQLIERTRPKDLLSEPDFRSCLQMLSNLLTFLEREITTNKKLQYYGNSTEEDEAELTQLPSVSKNASGSVTGWLYNVVEGFATTLLRTASNAVTSRTQTEMKDIDESGREPKYQGLIQLGTLVQEGNGAGDLVQRCKASLQWELTLDKAEEMTHLTRRVKKCFMSVNPFQRLDEENEESICNWEYRRSWDISSQLFYLLGEKTCQVGHEVSMQLNGFVLNESTVPPTLLVFMASCPLVPQGEWREGEYKSVPQEPKHSNFIGDICNHTRHRPLQVLDIAFTNDSMWYRPHNPVARPSSIEKAYPTISLAQLLDHGVLGSEESGGRFMAEDKSVLAFSLSLCLLHLFRGLWMQDVWNADAIQFLFKQDGEKGQIFNIHYPYIKRSLFRCQPISNPQLSAADCRPCLVSFARLLVEIDTGKPFPRNGNAKFEDLMWKYIQDITTEGKDAYAQAIEGCLQLTKGLNNSRRPTKAPRATRTPKLRGAKDSFDEVRQRIFQDVVRPLEKNYRRFSGIMEMPRAGPIEISAIPFVNDNGVNDHGNAKTHLPTTPPTNTLFRDSGSMCFFDDQLEREMNSAIEKKAEDFYARFRRFRRHFITPKMSNRRNGRTRLKIAILDTGIDKDDTWLDRACNDAIKERQKQGFRDLKETNPIQECWPPGEPAHLDNCGHGTYMTYLLLRYAPDADLYIAKVSEGMSFDDTDQVVEAIDWAIRMEVDIISMSFGSQDHINAIEKAIGRANSTPEYPTLIFASASNYGLNEPRTFPATDSRVICVHALDGYGGMDSRNPPRKYAEANYGTLGLGVRLHWCNQAESRSGTSYATPILAATLANVLDWLGFHADDENSELTHEQYQHLRKLDMIRWLLQEHMSVPEGNLRYVAPWELFPSNKLSEGQDDGNNISPNEREYAKVKEKEILGTLTLKLPTIR